MIPHNRLDTLAPNIEAVYGCTSNISVFNAFRSGSVGKLDYCVHSPYATPQCSTIAVALLNVGMFQENTTWMVKSRTDQKSYVFSSLKS